MKHGMQARVAELATAAGDMMKAVVDTMAVAENILAKDTMAETAVAVVVMATKRRDWHRATIQLTASDRRSTRGWLALQVLSAGLLFGLGSAPLALAQAPGQKTFNSVAEATDAFATAVGRITMRRRCWRYWVPRGRT